MVTKHFKKWVKQMGELSKVRKLHLVYVGMFDDRVPLYRKMSDYFHYILAQGFHLHLYFHRNEIFEEDIEKITKNKKELLKRLHIHEPVSFDKLSEEISKYDYGLDITFFTDIVKEGAFGAGNKLATYLEAGLPIILNKERRLFADIVKENKIGIVTEDHNLQDLKKKIEEADYEELVRNVLKFR